MGQSPDPVIKLDLMFIAVGAKELQLFECQLKLYLFHRLITHSLPLFRIGIIGESITTICFFVIFSYPEGRFIYTALMKILIDLDCFFVSAERTQNPELIGIPVAVGGRGDQHIFSAQNTRQSISLENSGAFVPSIMLQPQKPVSIKDRSYFTDPDGRIRGILTTASYEARNLGIKTPMPIGEALRICPELIILTPTFPLYHELSTRLRDFLQRRIPLIEQFSIDEFFGDLSGWVPDEEVPAFIEKLKEDIYDTFDLPVSIGAAPSKWIAKLASSQAKPFGTRTVYPKEHWHFVKDMPIGKFPGIGRKLQERFHSMQFHTLGDILNAQAYFNAQVPSIRELYRRIAGIDNDPVNPPKARKSIGVARTFDPIVNRDEIRRRLTILCRHLAFTILKSGVNPTHFHLYLRYELHGRAKGHVKVERLFSESLLREKILSLFDEIDQLRTYHLISISISTGHFSHQTKKALDMFTLHEDRKKVQLSHQSAKIRQKYGLDILKWGNELSLQ